MIHRHGGTHAEPCAAGLLWLLLPILVLLPLPSFAEEPIAVVTTIPVLKDLVQQVGASHVKVSSLLTGLENEHSYSPKPSDLIAVRKARLLVEIGAGLEVWVGSLLRNAGNRELTVLTVSQDIPLLDADPSHPAEKAAESHRHHAGNPHIWLDPENVGIMLSHITNALSRLDPAHAEDYARQASEYRRTLTQVTAECLEQLRPYSDRRLIAHHPAWPYFARRFRLEIVAEIQSQPGAEPSPRHLRALIERIRRDHIKVIVSEPQLNQKLPHLLAEETGAHLVVLTPLPGGVPGTDTYLDMLRYNVLQLARAFERPAA